MYGPHLLPFVLLVGSTSGVVAVDCPPDGLQNANITNNFTIPGFIPTDNGQSGVVNESSQLWTVIAGVTQSRATGNSAQFNLALDIPDAQLEQYHSNSSGSMNAYSSSNSSDWDPAPIVCTQMFMPNLGTLSLDTLPDGRCSGVASSQCLSDLAQYYASKAQNIAQSKSQQNVVKGDRLCNTLFAGQFGNTANWPSSCSQFNETAVQRPGFGYTQLDISKINETCTAGLMGYSPGTADTNFSMYDRAANGLVPWVFIRFGNASLHDTSVDVQIICPSAGGPGNTTSPGSRSVTLSSAAPSTQRLAFGAMTLTLVALLFVV